MKEEPIEMIVKSWSIKRKYRCPRCNKIMQKNNTLYHCSNCDIDVQLKMHMNFK